MSLCPSASSTSTSSTSTSCHFPHLSFLSHLILLTFHASRYPARVGTRRGRVGPETAHHLPTSSLGFFNSSPPVLLLSLIRSYLEQATDAIKGGLDSVASAVQPQQEKSTTQKVGDAREYSRKLVIKRAFSDIQLPATTPTATPPNWLVSSRNMLCFQV